jgi:hypothetical protein
VSNSQQDQIHVINRRFMGFIAKKIETNPLNGMKNKQGQQKQQNGNKGYWIRYNFLHFKIFVCKNKKYIFVS